MRTEREMACLMINTPCGLCRRVLHALYLAGEVKKAEELMLKAPMEQRDIGWYGFMVHLQTKIGETKDAEATAKEGISKYPNKSSQKYLKFKI